MPYRHAHWWVLALVPVILLAFWPAYLGTLRSAPFAFHAHGLTASAWMLLVAAQSWTIHTRRVRRHRALGVALLAVVPLFVGAGVLVMHSMAVKYASGSDPFYAALGARLGMHDLIATVVLVGMVTAALRHRRTVALHAGYMLGTVLLVAPPIIERLPLLPHGIHLSEGVPLVLALAIALKVGRYGQPFLIVAGVMLVQIVQFETFGASEAWGRLFAAFAAQPVGPWALAAMAAALAVLWSAWPRRTGARASIQPAA